MLSVKEGRREGDKQQQREIGVHRVRLGDFSKGLCLLKGGKIDL